MYRENGKTEQGSVQAAPFQDYNQHSGHYPPQQGMELARAYVPIQRLGQVYPPNKALEIGTLFPELYRPYHY